MKTDTIIIRISEQEKARWKAEADKRDMALSEYIRYVVQLDIDRSNR